MRYSWLFVAMLEFVRNWLINFFTIQKRVPSVFSGITRVIHAKNAVLNPFDLRAQIFRVNVESSAYYSGQKIAKSDLEIVPEK